MKHNLKYYKSLYNVLVLGILSASLFLASCIEKFTDDKVVEPDPNEEKDESDPSFNASDWIIFR